jgi:hypothetical protein
MDADRIKKLLSDVRSGDTTVERALDTLRTLPYEQVGDFARIDTHRGLRTGQPEVVFCPGKSNEQLAAIVVSLAASTGRVLATRAEAGQVAAVQAVLPSAISHPIARLITVGEFPPPAHPERSIAVLTAGTADTPVAEEAALILEWQGSRVTRLYDVGVAGLHRLLDRLDMVRNAHAVVVVAGMDGALASVVAGLVARPVVAVPTSAGYGTAFGGLAALLSMLNSCAGGVAVMNIDNGYGAAVHAHRINCSE